MKLTTTCNSCPLSKTRNKIVWGSGPSPAPVMLLGQNPGIAEDQSGRPFVGPSGRELEHMLWKQGVSREDVYITNLCKCRGEDDVDIQPEWVDKCASKFLIREIDTVQPRLIVALGAMAANWLIGPGHPSAMELLHGFVYPAGNPRVNSGINVLCCYHPAAGLHNPALLSQSQWDMEHLRAAMLGTLPHGPRIDIHVESLDYRVAARRSDIPEMLPPDPLGVIAVDTETMEGDLPWCLTASTAPGASIMIRANAPYLLREFDRYVRDMGFRYVIHNSLFDIPLLSQMGVNVDVARLHDTMTMAYLLQFIPKGLKPLSYRIAGVLMDSYTETTQPARDRKAQEYLREVVGRDWPDPGPVMVLKPDGTPHVKQPQNIKAKVKRALLDLEKGRCDDLRKRWLKMDGREDVERELGPMPDGWLSDLPLREAVGYACQDADCTRRIYPKLLELCRSRGLI